MTEHNLLKEIEEELERQKLEDLWRNYGPMVIAFALSIVIATACYVTWKSWRTEQMQEASTGLVTILADRSGNSAKRVEMLKAFADKHDGTMQQTLAQLHAATLEVVAGNKDKAIQIYDGIAKDSDAEDSFRQMSDLLSVQLQLDSGDPAALQKRLEPLAEDKAPWRYSAMEYQGYLALRTGDKAKAQKIFTQLAQNSDVPQTLSARAADAARLLNE